MLETKNRRIRDDFTLYNYARDKIRYQYESTSIKPQSPIWWWKAKDFNIYDDVGNKWIDYSSGIFVCNAGHSNPEINNAIKDQLDDDLSFAYSYYTNIRHKFVSKLLDCSPNHFEKVVLLNSGSEATDAAYRLIKIWGKKNNKRYIVTFNGSYHGRVLGADLLCGSKDSTEWSKVTDDDLVFIDFPYDEDTSFNISALPPKEQIAAFFLETYQGRTAQMYPKDYLRDLYTFAREAGALVCFDEVQSGFYRMGKLYGYMTYGEYEPDIICLGKGITSSLPMAAVLSTKEIIDVDTNLGSTHAGNALGCAAGVANIAFLTRDTFQEELLNKVSVFEQRLKRLELYDVISYVNVRGMVAAVIFKDPKVAADVVEFCFNNGIFPVNTWSDSIKFGPPLTITVDAIHETFDVIEDYLRDIK